MEEQYAFLCKTHGGNYYHNASLVYVQYKGERKWEKGKIGEGHAINVPWHGASQFPSFINMCMTIYMIYNNPNITPTSMNMYRLCSTSAFAACAWITPPPPRHKCIYETVLNAKPQFHLNGLLRIRRSGSSTNQNVGGLIPDSSSLHVGRVPRPRHWTANYCRDDVAGSGRIWLIVWSASGPERNAFLLI